MASLQGTEPETNPDAGSAVGVVPGLGTTSPRPAQDSHPLSIPLPTESPIWGQSQALRPLWALCSHSPSTFVQKKALPPPGHGRHLFQPWEGEPPGAAWSTAWPPSSGSFLTAGKRHQEAPPVYVENRS